MILSMVDNNKTIKSEKNSKIEVNLDTNPSTGYAWFVSEGNACELKDVVMSNPPRGMIGSPVNEKFIFEANRTGNLTILYKRPWTEEVLKVFSVNVVVE